MSLWTRHANHTADGYLTQFVDGTASYRIDGQRGRFTAFVDLEDTDYKDADADDVVFVSHEPNIVTSKVNGRPGQHAPVLDIDFPVTVVESSTPGHSHVYIDKPMDWHVYRDLLLALVAAGLVEEGYAEAAIHRGFTDVRLPWVTKESAA